MKKISVTTLLFIVFCLCNFAQNAMNTDLPLLFQTGFEPSTRIIPEDMKVVGKYPQPIHWLTILEIWNNVTWVQSVPYGFRITLGMGKVTEAESDLIFVREQGKSLEIYWDDFKLFGK